MTKVENAIRNVDPTTNKRKLAKESTAEKNAASASTSNALEDGTTKDENTFERPKKKAGRKRIKNKPKKVHSTSDGYFCGAPSKWQVKIQRKILMVNNID